MVADGFSGASPDQILGLDPMDIAKVRNMALVLACWRMTQSPSRWAD